MRAKRSTLRSAALAWVVAAAGMAHAQDYPTRPVRLIVPFPPGGGTDILARMIAPRLSDALGQTVVVDNRPGADGIVGSEITSRANPDGYTFLIVSASHAINPALGRKLPYDTLRDFAYITQTAVQQVLLMAHPSVPVRSVKEVIDAAKAKPNAFNYGSSSNAAALPMELFKHMAGVQIQHVPYKGSGPMLNDLLAGQVQLSIGGAVSAIPHVKSGKLRALGIGDSKRSSFLPDVPTIAEAGVPGYQATIWTGMLAPARTPQAIVDRLGAEVAKIVRNKEFTARMHQLGSDTVGSTGAEWRKFIAAEIEKWSRIARIAGMTAQ